MAVQLQTMNHRIIPLSQLNEGQIKYLAHLHSRAVQSLLGNLGLPFIERYYQIVRTDASVIGIGTLGPDETPLGWAVGSSKPDQLIGRLREAPVWFALQLMRAVVARPLLLPQLLASARMVSIPLKSGAVELTYIAVVESVRRQGLGRALLLAFLEAALERKFRSVELSVEAENTDAIALYTGVGFQITASFKEGAYYRYRMELILE